MADKPETMAEFLGLMATGAMEPCSSTEQVQPSTEQAQASQIGLATTLQNEPATDLSKLQASVAQLALDVSKLQASLSMVGAVPASPKQHD